MAISINDLISQIQALQTNASALAAFISGLESSNTTLTTANTGLASQVATLTSQLNAANAKIIDLQNQLNNPPVPPAAGTAFGIDVATLGETDPLPTIISKHRASYGPTLPHIRIFAPGTIDQWGTPVVNALVPGDKPVFSFKVWDDAAMKSFFDNIPAAYNEVWVCHYHEPEDDAKKAPSLATFINNYLNVYVKLDNLRKSHPNGKKVKIAKIMMNFQETTAKVAGATWKEFHGGQMFVDAFGFDCYSQNVTKYLTPDFLFSELIACAKGTGVPVCVPELGLQLVTGDDGTGLAATIQTYIAYAKKNNFVWVNWWCAGSQGAKGLDWRLESKPKALAAWRAAMGN